MKFFKKTTTSVNEFGRVTETDVRVVDVDNDVSPDSILDETARDMQANGFSVYWSFEEQSFKAVHNQYADLIRYVTVTEL